MAIALAREVVGREVDQIFTTLSESRGTRRLSKLVL
jgi:hypothetical protein